MGSVDECEHFFHRFDPEAAVVSDPDASFYGPFGLERGGAGEFLSPAVFAAGLRAVLKGNGIGVPVGDVRRMPGAFLVKDDEVRWKFLAGNAGDHPDLSEIARRTPARTTAGGLPSAPEVPSWASMSFGSGPSGPSVMVTLTLIRRSPARSG